MLNLYLSSPVLLVLLAGFGTPQRLHYGDTVARRVYHLIDSPISAHRERLPSAGDDKFHLSRVERIRYGKAFRPQALPLVAEAPHSDECKYKKEPWQDCDSETKQQTRRLVLKKGNPSCESTKEISRSCKTKPSSQATPKKITLCRYKKGTWSDCDNHSGLKTRTDTLKISRNSQLEQTRLIRENCEPSRVMTRKCKATKLGCKYNRAVTWSECDSRTNLRTKILKLEKGYRSSSDCEPERRITRTCRLGGKDRKLSPLSAVKVHDEDDKRT